MTIRELCNKHECCIGCPVDKLCTYLNYWVIPLNKLNDRDNEEITNAIIETAKILTEGVI